MGKERSSRHSDRDRGRDDDKKKRRRSRSRDDSYSPKRKHSKGSESSSKKNEDKEKRVRKSDTSMIEAEADVKKRKERVEKWRALMKKKEEEEMKDNKEENGNIVDQDSSNLNISISAEISTEEKHSTWTLEDENDDDDEEEIVNNNLEEHSEEKKEQPVVEVQDEEEIDPLDLFMSELEQSNETKPKIDTVTVKSTSKLKVITAPVAKTIHEQIDAKKGDIIENDDTNYEAKDDFDLEEAKEQFITKSRTLLQVDHEKVYYAPFNKNFYREVPELTKMTDEEVKEYRKELEGIKIRGTGTLCKPLKSWAQCGFEWKLLSFLKKLGYEKPTPIQAQAIPCILSGRDVIGIAKTGSGKTLAFLLPMFRHILDQPELDEGDGPISLILTPTRELAMQIWKETQKFSKLLKLKSVCVYGGVGISEQIADLKRQPEIVICTPGRMIEMLHSNNGKVTNLRRITYVVLDEADRMFDMGFEPQVMKIIQNIRPDKQMLLFSATFPKQMEALARKVLDKPVEIQVGGKSIVCKDVCQNVTIIEECHKFLKLLELLGIYYETGNVIIFTEKQEKADEIVNMLIKAGYMAAPLHGSIDQFDRDSTIVDFKQGVVKILVATSVAARGLDVKKLKLVINYDCPNHYEDYVHRVGRTGRAGNKGFAYTFILPEGQEKMAGEICRAFESADLKPPQELKDMFKKWKEDMKKEGKVVKIGTGGFGGSGYKYDAIEDEAAVNKRKMEKLLLGMENQVMDDDDEIEEHLTSMMKSNKRYLEKGAINSKIATPAVGNIEAATAASDSAMEKVKAVAARIAAERAMAAETKPIPIQSGSIITAPNVITGSTIHINVSAAEKAKQIAEALNEKLNYIPTENSSIFDAPENIHYFEEELEINDFPQQVRYKVCSRETISRIQEIADVGISVKGTYYPNNKEPKFGDRKLYLFIEARDEFSLKRAKEEIIYTMKEAFKQITGANKGPQGRYKIV